MTINDYYQTSDLALASLISLFFPLDCIDKTDPHKALFIFKRQPELDQVVEQYWKGELLVEPQRYFNQLKILKTRLYHG